MNHIVDQRKIYLRHRYSSNFPLCSFCNLCFHEKKPFNLFCTLAASLSIARLSELLRKLFSLSPKTLYHLLISGKLCFWIGNESIFQSWKAEWKSKTGKFCFPLTTFSILVEKWFEAMFGRSWCKYVIPV